MTLVLRPQIGNRRFFAILICGKHRSIKEFNREVNRGVPSFKNLRLSLDNECISVWGVGIKSREEEYLSLFALWADDRMAVLQVSFRRMALCCDRTRCAQAKHDNKENSVWSKSPFARLRAFA